MTRFTASTPDERYALFTDAFEAYQMRDSAYLTLQAVYDPAIDTESNTGPWIQFGENMFNVDVTPKELDELKTVVSEYAEFQITDIDSPESADGSNVKIRAITDTHRLVQFTERLFLTAFARDEEYQAWVTEI
ncbi:MAG: hypothetical protein J07HQX50_01919 [Haloquadratum sp. J07HQX50]|jgi:hypothetical protein|nr:MAG: hypothetical protein J07HQX50_01919 [Haloquadratum sp. J07HQX50]